MERSIRHERNLVRPGPCTLWTGDAPEPTIEGRGAACGEASVTASATSHAMNDAAAVMRRRAVGDARRRWPSEGAAMRAADPGCPTKTGYG